MEVSDPSQLTLTNGNFITEPKFEIRCKFAMNKIRANEAVAYGDIEPYSEEIEPEILELKISNDLNKDQKKQIKKILERRKGQFASNLAHIFEPARVPQWNLC